MSGDKRSVATDALEVLGLPDLGGREVGRDAIHLAVEPAVAGERLTPGGSIHRIKGLWYHCMITERLAIVDPFLTVHVDTGQRFLAIVPPRQITSLRHVWSHPDFPEEVANPCAEQSILRPQPGGSVEPESSPAMFRHELEEAVERPDESDEEEAVRLSEEITAKLDARLGDGALSDRDYAEAWIREMIAMTDCPDYDTLVGVASGDYTAGGDPEYGGRHPQWSDEYLSFNGKDAHGVIPRDFWRYLRVVTGGLPPREPLYFSCSC